jgi:hypothetical protein
MVWLRIALALSLTACLDAGDQNEREIDLASADSTPAAAGKTDAPGWEIAPTLHANTSQFDLADAGTRRVHALWVAGSNTNRVAIDVAARANDGDSVRIAVLGPAVGGVRPVLAADGYTVRKQAVAVSLAVATPGEHLVVVGSHRLATPTTYELSATCPDETCGVSRVDALASPKDFALVGDGQRIIHMILGDMLIGFGDIEVELWRSPPMQWWNATKVATSQASGSQVNAIAPFPAVRWGDDVRLVVREAGDGGRILDTGVTTRFLPTPTNFVRLDAILYGDIASLQIAGAVGFFEGQADLRLRSETRHIELAATSIHADRPGMVGNGFNAFDATFLPDLAVAPHDGELLSIGTVDGNGTVRRLGCFEYCNNLSGMSPCTGGPRSCP